MKYFFAILCLLNGIFLAAQKDSLRQTKIRHAEPLYSDLVRDLGARKGEQEWNTGFGVEDHKRYISYTGFAEYEFAPARRLGIEIEIPFTFYQPATDTESAGSIPGHGINGIKLALQYTFFVSPKAKLSMAAGYMQELEFRAFRDISVPGDLFGKNIYSPFFVIAKKWGKNVHTMLYTGPEFTHDLHTARIDFSYQVNASAHYMIPKTSHFIGVEVNHEFSAGRWSLFVRPQAKVKICNGLAIGMVLGIPADFRRDGMQFFTRLIYEPQRQLAKQKR